MRTEMMTNAYRDDDEIEVATENHKHLCDILQEISCSFGHNISILDFGCGTGRYFHCLQNVERLIGIFTTGQFLTSKSRYRKLQE